MWEQIGLTSLPLLTRALIPSLGPHPHNLLNSLCLGSTLHKHLLSLSISLTFIFPFRNRHLESDLLPFPSIVVWSLSHAPTSSKPDSLLEDSSPNTIVLGLGFQHRNLGGPQIFSSKCFPRGLHREGQERKLQERRRERAVMKRWYLSAAQQVLDPKLQSCSNVGPSNYKVLSYQWVRAAS